ncbi:LysR family transcriptional regulator [Rhodoferax sp. GW822-FHT02A01]|uniref:LysR family transcriptional regulator n=1 Tax=Rhodoferax sp. GW822-FHT02A01 TaxID=3141537 RepID=UPI00315C7CFC
MGNIVPFMEQLNPNDLLIYARVADSGSFSKAAERLGLPKSTVSRRVSFLEEQLGERLMVRSTRRSSFTEFGLQLLEHARQVAAEVDAVAALREHRQVQPTGRLRVSMPSEVAVYLLEDMLAAFSAMHPGVSLEMDLSPRRVDLLAEGFDIALRFGVLQDDATLVARKLATMTNGLYASPAYLTEHGTPRTPQDLEKHRGLLLLKRNNEPLIWTLQKDDQRWEGAPPSSFAANSPDMLVRMATRGSGIVAVPDRFAQALVKRGKLRRVLSAWCLPSDAAWAVFVGRRLMPAKTRAFIEMLQAALGDGTGESN